jgi:hypothetical protein
MAKAAMKQEEDYFHQPTGLRFKEETNKVLHLGNSCVWC